MSKDRGKKKVTGVYFDAALDRVLKIIAAMEGRSVSDITSDAVNAHLREKYGEDALEVLKRCQEPMEAAAIISAIQIREGTPVDNTLLAGLERSFSRERI